jgi:long-chain acyl-CoA synthetase
MKGYFNRPEETADVIRNGWFQTGDIGEIDPQGFLKITDRKKDLFKTSGGKYICPQPIENQLKTRPLISNAVVVGAGRKYASALLVPNVEAVATAVPTSAGKPDLTQPAVRDLFQRELDLVNQKLAKYETIKKFALLDRDFTIEGGELTPTMKVRRRVVEEKYRPQIDALYEDESKVAIEA